MVDPLLNIHRIWRTSAKRQRTPLDIIKVNIIAGKPRAERLGRVISIGTDVFIRRTTLQMLDHDMIDPTSLLSILISISWAFRALIDASEVNKAPLTTVRRLDQIGALHRQAGS